MIVDITGLTKIYPGKPPVTAVDGVDLHVAEGAVFGLLGPNGAGKTTTISIATTRALPTSGEVRIAGMDVVREPARSRRSIGVVPQYNTLDRSLTIEENLYFHCRYFGYSRHDSAARAAGLLAQFHLSERASAFPSQLSGGLAQRVLVARAIAHRPTVLFLDEPSAGLDPQSRIAMWEVVRGLRNEGITVVMTTHYMEEAEELCDRVAIIDHGRILVEDTPANLKAGIGAQTIYELKLRDFADAPALAVRIGALPRVASAEATPDGLRVFAETADGLLPELVGAVQSHGLRDIAITEPSLETVFIRLTGRELRD